MKFMANRIASAGLASLLVLGLTTSDLLGFEFAPSDWPWWRGPNYDGSVTTVESPITKWDETTNIAWRVPVPGRGHASPIVVGSQVFLPTADHDRELQSVLCFDRQTGERQWETVVHRGGLMSKNEKASQASSTIACDGKLLFVSFLNDGAVYTTALDRAGKQIWQTKISDYVIHQGYGASPAIYKSMVIVVADNKGGGAVAALDRETGAMIWQRERPDKPNYPSPVVFQIGGRDQLLFTGCDLVTSLDPNTGATLWEIEGATTECVTTTVTDGERIFTSGGYPRNHMSAVEADGSGHIAWENTNRVYVPSMLIRDHNLFAVLDAGTAGCWDSKTGKNRWKGRLGGTFSSSPVLVGELIYATNETGTTYVFKASSERFEKVAENQLGEEVFATPTFSGNDIFHRVAYDESGRRQEYLVCIRN